MYACYHGPEGLKKIAERVHLLTVILARGLESLVILLLAKIQSERNSLIRFRVISASKAAAEILKLAEAHRINFRAIDDAHHRHFLDETTTEKDLNDIFASL